MPGSQPVSHEEDVLSRQLFLLGLKLILVATARPDLISVGTVLARKCKDTASSADRSRCPLRPNLAPPPERFTGGFAVSCARRGATSRSSTGTPHVFTSGAAISRSSPMVQRIRLRKIIWIRPTTVGEQLAKAA
jgi:hypothetical protein